MIPFVLLFMICAVMLGGKGILFCLGRFCNTAILKEDALSTSMLKKIFWFGVLSDLISVTITAVLMSVIEAFDSYIGGFLINIGMLAIYPLYGADMDLFYASMLPILIAIAISAVISLIFNCFFVFRKSELKKRQKVKSLLVFFFTTAPYYLLISLSFVLEMLL